MTRPTLFASGILLVVAGCSAPTSEPGSFESNYTSDAGAADEAPRAPAGEVPRFALSEIAPEPQVRFQVMDGPIVEGADAKLTVAVSGADRRFVFEAATPTPAGAALPLLHLEFGRGAASIEPGTYDCADNEAVAVLVKTRESKIMTATAGGPQRACVVTIDEAVAASPLPNVPLAETQATRRVTGHFTATLGPREDADAPTTEVRGAFAAYVSDQR